MTRDKSKEILKAGLLVLFLSIIFLLTQIPINNIPEFSRIFNKDVNITGTQNLDASEDYSGWVIYSNEIFSVSFMHPDLLIKRSYENSGGYELFVVFEENNLSREKGVAFGVSRTGIDEETERIKNNISGQGSSEVVREDEVDFKGKRAKYLVFESRDETLENRSVLIVQKEDYTYSFSTVPEQMRKLISSIKFND